MTTTEANAARIFEDARRMNDAALERLAAGDIRDAAEKAWCATVRATEALVLARTGLAPDTSTAASRRLRELAISHQPIRQLRRSYLKRQRVLHGECFYHDYCHPVQIDLMVRETTDYVRDAERLAQNLPNS